MCSFVVVVDLLFGTYLRGAVAADCPRVSPRCPLDWADDHHDDQRSDDKLPIQRFQGRTSRRRPSNQARSPFMRRVPSVGFSLDATAPVPNRTLPRQAKPASPQPQQSSDEPAATGRQSPPRNNVPLAEHLEGQSPALRIVLLALAAGFKEVGGRLRYGLRMPSGLDASVDAHRVEAAGDVGRLDRAVGHFLVEALSKTGVCCTIALETHEGLVEVPCGPGWVRGGARVWASSRCLAGLVGLGVGLGFYKGLVEV